MNLFGRKTPAMPSAATALKGRPEPIVTAESHRVTGAPLKGPYPQGSAIFLAGMGCFWGAERLFWLENGVYHTAVGYAGGFTPNPTYEEVCSGMTGHAEVVNVVYDGDETTLRRLLTLFWESHDPTQGWRQGNDVGTQYRSALFMQEGRDLTLARETGCLYAQTLAHNGYGAMTTDIHPMMPFYYAEAEHQQYLARHPNGYCGLKGTGVSCAF